MNRALFCLFLVIAGCTSSIEQKESLDTSVGDTIADLAPGTVDTSSVLFKGLYSFGNEMSVFISCDGKHMYWLNDSLSNLQSRYKAAADFLSYPYESRYVEIKGYLAGRSELGYASEYENVLMVKEVLKMEPKNFKTACYNYEFIALGNEPFWSLDIIPGEKLIVFKDAGNEKVYQFPFVVSKEVGNSIRYETTSEKHGKLIAIFKKEKCSDGMSDRVYQYSATVSFSGKSYSGCGIRKGDTFQEN